MRPSSWWRRWCCRAGRRASSITLVPAEMVGGRPAGTYARAGPAGARAAGAGQSQRRRLLRGPGEQAGRRAEAEGGRAVLDRRPLLSPAMLRLTRWMADYYLCPWGQVLEAVVPAGVRHEAGTRDVTLLSVPPDVAARTGEVEASGQAGGSASNCWPPARDR